MKVVTGSARSIAAFLKSLWRGFSGRVSLLFSLFFLGLLALLYLLATEPGRITLTRGAIFAAEQLFPRLDIAVGPIASDHLGAWSFSHLKIDYGDGTLTQVRDLAVDIDLGALLRGRIDIKAVNAAELVFDIDLLNRLLAAQPEAEKAAPEGKPVSPPAVRLGALDIQRLRLIDSRMPELPVVSVRADGRYQWQGEAAGLALEIRERNGFGLRIGLTGKETEPGRYRLEFSASEGAGGFAGKQLQLPEGQALDMRGRIALRQTDGRLQVEIEAISLPLSNHRFNLSGNIEIMFSPWKISTEELLLGVDGSQHRIAGSVSADAVEAEIKLQKLPVDISRPWQNHLLGGWLSADLSIRGPLPLPSISGILDLNSRFRFNADEPEQPLRLQARVQTRDKVIGIASATLDYAGAGLEAEGQVNLGDRSLDLSGVIRALSLDDIRELLAVIPGRRGSPAPGGNWWNPGAIASHC